MKTTHTPGEWITKEGQIYPQETGKTLALIPYFDRENEDQQANAKIIAAAPELLEALQNFVDAVDFIISNESEMGGQRIDVYRSIQKSPVYFKAKQAILKATQP